MTVTTVPNHAIKRLPNTAISLTALFHVFFFHRETFVAVTGYAADQKAKKKKKNSYNQTQSLECPRGISGL